MRGFLSFLLISRDLCFVHDLKLGSPRTRSPCRIFNGYMELLMVNRGHSSRYLKHGGKTLIMLLT